jgi:PAS domain S-box-containing protein
MKIRSLFIVSTAIFIILFIIISASVVIVSQQAEETNRQRDAATMVVQDAYELDRLSMGYLLDPKEPQLALWHAGCATLTDHLALLTLVNPEQQVLLDAMRSDLSLLGMTVDGLALTTGTNATTGAGAGAPDTGWNRIADADQRIIGNASALRDLITEDLNRVRFQRTVFVFALMGICLAVFLVNILLVYRRIITSVRDLGEGTRIIASGDLGYRIAEHGDDEFRELAASFNAMTASRKSVEDELLQKHVELFSAYEKLAASEEELRENYNELARVGKELRESEEKYRLVSDNAEDWIYWVAPDRSIRYTSPSCERVTGYSPAEFAARPQLIDEIIHPDDREILEQHMGDIQENRPHRVMEFRIVTKTGEIRWISHTCSPIVTEDGTYAGRLGTNRNITQRKQAEETVQLKDELLRLTGKMAQAGGWEFDVMTGEGTWTDEVARIHDLDPALPTNAAYGLSFYTGPSRTRIESAIRDAIEQAAPFDIELEMTTATGRHKWVRTIGTPVLERGRVIRLRGVFQDITLYKNIEEDLIRSRLGLEDKVAERTRDLTAANEKLRELDKLKSLFIASMSHELRTPLNSIIGFTGILIRGLAGEVSDEQKKQLGMVQESSRHLLALINDIIDISKIEAGKIEPEISTFDCVPLVREVERDFSEAATDAGLALSIDLPASLVIASDQRRVKQVVMNLVSNAVKFTDHGEINIKGEEKEGFVEITVRDTGIGIPADQMENLFLQFSRISTPGRITEGTGLGLYLSMKLARMLGGDIGVASRQGTGSTFVFRVPADNRKSGAARP